MTARHPAALHPSTVQAAGQAGAVRLAAATGFDLVGVRLGPAHPADPTPSLLGEPQRLRELRRALDEAGVRVLDVEVVRVRPGAGGDGWEPLLELGAELGARYILAVNHDPDAERAASALHALAESADARRLLVGLEFMAFTETRSAAAARDLVSRAAHLGLGIVADPLHLYRGGGDADDLAGLFLLAAQLCDVAGPAPATAEALAAEARSARLMPGEGRLPLADFVAALPPGLPVSLEVTADTTEDSTARALRGRAAMRALGI